MNEKTFKIIVYPTDQIDPYELADFVSGISRLALLRKAGESLETAVIREYPWIVEPYEGFIVDQETLVLYYKDEPGIFPAARIESWVEGNILEYLHIYERCWTHFPASGNTYLLDDLSE